MNEYLKIENETADTIAGGVALNRRLTPVMKKIEQNEMVVYGPFKFKENAKTGQRVAGSVARDIPWIGPMKGDRAEPAHRTDVVNVKKVGDLFLLGFANEAEYCEAFGMNFVPGFYVRTVRLY